MTDIEKLLDKHEIEFIQYQFTTITGELKTVEFPANIWDEMKNGTGVDGSSLGFLDTEQSDMKIIPDYHTFSTLPWDETVGRFICSTFTNNGDPHPTDPRGLLQKIISQAHDMGFQYITRPELEWFFLDLDLQPVDEGEYMETFPLDPMGPLRRIIVSNMLSMGIPVKTIHHECGHGQQEIELMPVEALTQADNVQTSKFIIKTNALFEGVIATFMPKPFPHLAGNGLHIHQYLQKGEENVFADPNEGVSDILRWFVGGILEHVDAMTAVLNPITNSYRRLIPGFEAPVYKSWGIGNRTALIRVPGYEKKARIEYRGTDGATNIYLASALLLAAGLDGIKKKIEPIAPTTKNIDKLTDQERKQLGITKLPVTLEEALEQFEQSKFIRDVLGKETVELYGRYKKKELDAYMKEKKKGKEAALNWEKMKYLYKV